MAAVVVLLLMLGTGIVVGIKSKKLTVTELVVCGGFGLILGGTDPGGWLYGLIVEGGNAAGPIIATWLS